MPSKFGRESGKAGSSAIIFTNGASHEKSTGLQKSDDASKNRQLEAKKYKGRKTRNPNVVNADHADQTLRQVSRGGGQAELFLVLPEAI